MPASSRPARIGFLLSQLGAHASEVFAEQVRELGVTPSEAGVIRIIGRTPGMSQRDLAEKLGIVQSRVVAIIDRLETAGLARRTRSSSDRRVQNVELTEAGSVVLRKLRGAAEAQESVLVDGLSATEASQLSELLARLSELRGLDADVHPGYRSER